MAGRILVADLLCGAGGSSTGCEQALHALGYDMELVCVNHWPMAIETHTRNHPRARHYCQDISTVRPHIVVPEGRLDLLLASPSCTHHSVARGGKPTSDQQRSDPWHIITWLTELDVNCLVIENVWEFRNWGPVDAVTGKPIKARKGEYFNAWIDVIRRLGYELEWRKLNAADYGEATTRQRFIMFGRKDGQPITWPAPSHGEGTDQRWRPARDIIDWTIKGKSIFKRKRKLADKTLARIEAGAIKHGWPEPFLVILRNHMDGKSIDGPVPTIAANGNHIGLAEPILIKQNFRRDTLSVDAPVPTVMTVARIGLIEPFVLSQASGGAPRAVSEPLPTATTDGAIALISPYYGSGSGETCNHVDEPLPTVTAKARFGLVMPVTHSDMSSRARDVEIDPLPTITTARRGELAFIAAAFGEREGQAPRVHSVDEPTPAICATGRINLVEASGYDILFRMLEPHELAAAMGFSSEDQPYEFAGNKTEKVKQIGNAVPVRLMKACVTAVMGAAPIAVPDNDADIIQRAAE